ncbi:hypothetical protein K491DRAFT_763440 [Lophiostoma macrostomum CBS 122681]|uniref:Uncharacterized protein n=1 Tax=Lophiostoma macrostomum CBS 122681 TaxID=1314788 RepID=A0A6A6SKC1_9PLEO|nr:hypothetical protein K491DRAFT_763440 [Lophiostoma macrostomum CBS 122681]
MATANSGNAPMSQSPLGQNIDTQLSNHLTTLNNFRTVCQEAMNPHANFMTMHSQKCQSMSDTYVNFVSVTDAWNNQCGGQLDPDEGVKKTYQSSANSSWEQANQYRRSVVACEKHWNEKYALEKERVKGLVGALLEQAAGVDVSERLIRDARETFERDVPLVRFGSGRQLVKMDDDTVEDRTPEPFRTMTSEMRQLLNNWSKKHERTPENEKLFRDLEAQMKAMLKHWSRTHMKKIQNGARNKQARILDLEKQLRQQLDALVGSRIGYIEAVAYDESMFTKDKTSAVRRKTRAKKNLKRVESLLNKVARHPQLEHDADLGNIKRKLYKLRAKNRIYFRMYTDEAMAASTELSMNEAYYSAMFEGEKHKAKPFVDHLLEQLRGQSTNDQLLEKVRFVMESNLKEVENNNGSNEQEGESEEGHEDDNEVNSDDQSSATAR